MVRCAVVVVADRPGENGAHVRHHVRHPEREHGEITSMYKSLCAKAVCVCVCVCVYVRVREGGVRVWDQCFGWSEFFTMSRCIADSTAAFRSWNRDIQCCAHMYGFLTWTDRHKVVRVLDER